MTTAVHPLTPGEAVPNRIIRESARTSPTLAQLSDGGERLFWRLVTFADDFGRFDANPRIVLGACFPLNTKIRPGIISAWLLELAKVGAIGLYSVDGRPYGHFLSWEKHQRVRNQHSKYPEPTQSGTRSIDSDSRAIDRDSRPVSNRDPIEIQSGILLPPPTPSAAEVTSVEAESPTGAARKLLDEDPDAWAARPWPSPHKLAALYNEHVHNDLVAVEILDSGRKEKARKVLSEHAEMGFWIAAFRRTHHSPFLRGRGEPRPGNKKPFKADFDFFLQHGQHGGAWNVTKVWEGKYDS